MASWGQFGVFAFILWAVIQLWRRANRLHGQPVFVCVFRQLKKLKSFPAKQRLCMQTLTILQLFTRLSTLVCDTIWMTCIPPLYWYCYHNTNFLVRKWTSVCLEAEIIKTRIKNISFWPYRPAEPWELRSLMKGWYRHVQAWPRLMQLTLNFWVYHGCVCFQLTELTSFRCGGCLEMMQPLSVCYCQHWEKEQRLCHSAPILLWVKSVAQWEGNGSFQKLFLSRKTKPQSRDLVYPGLVAFLVPWHTLRALLPALSQGHAQQPVHLLLLKALFQVGALLHIDFSLATTSADPGDAISDERRLMVWLLGFVLVYSSVSKFCSSWNTKGFAF